MKIVLFRWLFKKELQGFEERYEAELRKLSRELSDKSQEVEHLKTYCEIPKRAFSFFPNSEILGLQHNKKVEEVFVLRNQNESLLTLYLFGKSYLAINGLPRLMAKIATDYRNNDKHIEIMDIQTVNIDVGNGSILMEHFLKSSKAIGAKSVKGWLSGVDADHFDRSEHFYKKFGFQVRFDEHRTSGSIELELK